MGSIGTSLTDWNEPKSRQRIMQLKREFVRIRLKEDETMTLYVSKMKICNDYLRAAGCDVKDEDLAYAMLTGLPDSYDALTMSLANLDEGRFTSNEIKKALLMEYDRRTSKNETQDTKSEVAAYQVNKSNTKQNAHKPSTSHKCFKCGKLGHFAKQCRSKISNTKDYQKTQKKRDLIALLSTLYSTITNDAWLLDSAATHHVCKRKEWFKNFNDIAPQTINTANAFPDTNEMQLTAKGTGDVALNTRIGGKEYEIKLSNVYYVPSCRRNLMSVAQIEKKTKIVKFENGVAKLIDPHSGKIFIKALRNNDLYIVQADVVDLNDGRSIKLHALTLENSNLWHGRFCHISNRSIEELAKKGYVRGLENSKIHSEKCSGCCIGKSTKAPCKQISGKQSTEILELVHSDVCGPMPVESIGGAKYFMTLIDDYSRKIEVHFLRNKNEVAQIIKRYIAKTEREKGLKVKRLRTDNGLEYCNKEITELFNEMGIKHKRTCVETPQMNGVAERVNRTLMDMVRSMLSSSKLPTSFWTEATSAAAYAKNRMTHSSLDNRVPEGIWTERPPSVKHLKVYGCLAYAHLPTQGRRKIDPRAVQCILVEYSNQTKGYRLWDPKKKQIIQTKHVEFDETKIGYKTIVLNDNTQICFELTEPNTQSEANEESIVKPSMNRNLSQISQIAVDDDEYTSNSEDEETQEATESTIVGASTEEPQVKSRGRPKKKPPRNPYGCKGKPKTNIEINLTEILEPINLKEALESPQSDEWIKGINEEIENLERLNTWVYESSPSKNYIGSKWVFKL